MNNQFPLADLQALLKQARQTDAELKQFGAKKHKYQLNPPATPAEVEAFEQQLGCTLPEAYRSFLLQAGNGGAGPFYGLLSLEEVQNWLDWPLAADLWPPAGRRGPFGFLAAAFGRAR